MKNSSHDALNKEFHARAEQLAKEYVDEFAASLLLQATMLASQERAEVVLSNHVDEAREILIKERKTRWYRELLIVLGTRCLGLSYQDSLRSSPPDISYSPL